MTAPELVEFAKELDAELRHEADLEGVEAMVAEVFTRRMLETLIEAGEIEEAVDCFHVNDAVRPAVEVSGYGIEDEDTLNLAVTLYRGGTPEPLAAADAKRALRRARAFWLRCKARPYYDELEESSEAWDMAVAIHGAAPKITRVRIFLLTDGIVRTEWLEPEFDDGVEYREAIWDLQRLWRLEASGRRSEPIEVDFVEEFGDALPALAAETNGEAFRAYLAVVPGPVLAEIYDRFGARLLERNVRSFLQFTGKVNRGMRDTIRDEPENFLPFNNGISATAAEVRVGVTQDGTPGITYIRDLQVVNGGQTTASIHRAFRSKIDVEKIQVQAKITEVQGQLLDELVPRISEYANSQNKVQLADLSSNQPFHIEIETLSRSVWAPATAETTRQTKWFYERARGQYADAKNRELTPARQKAFQGIHPPKQKITKVDLATYENTWDQYPHEVSKGAQKNFGFFMTNIARRGKEFRPDAAYFQRTVAKAILFRRAERIVSQQEFGGYRRNIVTYSLARLSLATDQRLDLERIWNAQEIDEPIAVAIEQLSHVAYRVLTDDSRPSQNVTEWAKREECWDQMRRARWDPPPELDDLVLTGARSPSASDNGGGATDQVPPELEFVRTLTPADGDTFLAIAEWAKQTDNLTSWQRQLAKRIGVAVKQGKQLTDRQAPRVKEIYDEAVSCGFELGAD